VKMSLLVFWVLKAEDGVFSSRILVMYLQGHMALQPKRPALTLRGIFSLKALVTMYKTI
jgi:hypothetical protein